MFHLWYERQMDRELHIKTQFMREWTEIEDLLLYNRLESTPYQALDKLFEFNDLGSDSNFVDFGCGSGRVAFYVHNRFNIPVTGIELNLETYYELEDNLTSYIKANPKVNFAENIALYQQVEQHNISDKKYNYDFKPGKNNKRSKNKKVKQKPAPIKFVQEYAELYQIQNNQNVFYFFNPFTIKIFTQVIRNIEHSLFDNPRAAEIILYYPMYDYQTFMENKTIFQREGSISLDMLEDEFEKFIIYRYDPIINT
ncbi:MAG TPA: hypothetical protein GXZ43_03615 [Clostridiaceae bacterium]|nr:hypothetical protein [Clostridiaceae bacterium]